MILKLTENIEEEFIKKELLIIRNNPNSLYDRIINLVTYTEDMPKTEMLIVCILDSFGAKYLLKKEKYFETLNIKMISPKKIFINDNDKSFTRAFLYKYCDKREIWYYAKFTHFEGMSKKYYSNKMLTEKIKNKIQDEIIKRIL